jgi:3,4-dihydroxy-2-butanone 4-phosphate synthase
MGADYVLLGDINDHPDEEAKKQDLVHTFRKADKEKIVVVIKEIEGWYLAGLDEENSKKLGIPYLDNTDHITKEQFNNMRPGNFDSEIDFMVEIIKHFSVETAVKKNKSFKGFFKRYCK